MSFSFVSCIVLRTRESLLLENVPYCDQPRKKSWRTDDCFMFIKKETHHPCFPGSPYKHCKDGTTWGNTWFPCTYELCSASRHLFSVNWMPSLNVQPNCGTTMFLYTQRCWCCFLPRPVTSHKASLCLNGHFFLMVTQHGQNAVKSIEHILLHCLFVAWLWNVSVIKLRLFKQS